MAGRPKRPPIDWTEVDKLCYLQCTRQEVAWFLDISVDTLDRALKKEKQSDFATYFEQKASKGRMSLRRRQYEVAMSGNVSMLIWLGKNWLNQSDKLEQKTENTGDPTSVVYVANWGGKSEPSDPTEDS